MLLFLGAILLAAWCLFMGIKFYRTVDWGEPADPSPDLQGMHKREAELLHVQSVLEAAQQEGKLSASVVDEFNRFCDTEIESMRKVETAWKTRPRKPN
jgi:hypothetical protein